jgi:NMD protein affecting ribosome stability and mRNA decay
MSTRKGKRYTTSYKEKQDPKQDPYAMFKAPKGPVMCRKCKAVYVKKRWSIDSGEARRLAEAPGIKKILCPACQKIRDDYPEGIVTLKWSDLRERETEIKGLIANVEARAVSVNPLDRVMRIARRKKDLEVQTTNDRLAHRLGRALVRAYKGKADYKWAHRDMMVRVTWEGPEPKLKPKVSKRARSKT